MSDMLALLFPHQAETRDIRVRVAVNYLSEQSAPAAGRWFWSYHVRLENHGEETVQLLTRHWRIVDGRGDVHAVSGQGVVGEMPVIAAGQSFDYVSGCPLDTSTGEMTGHYTFVAGSGEPFEVTIPRFALVGPSQ